VQAALIGRLLMGLFACIDFNSAYVFDQPEDDRPDRGDAALLAGAAAHGRGRSGRRCRGASGGRSVAARRAGDALRDHRHAGAVHLDTATGNSY
jgi:hypothetical protein